MDLLVLLFIISVVVSDAGGVKECIPRSGFLFETILCVCNSTYCDNVEPLGTRKMEHYAQYTTSMGGQRLQRQEGQMKPMTEYTPKNEGLIPDIFRSMVLKVNRTKVYQEVFGFGISFTDSSGINLKNMTRKSRRNVMKSFFGKDGIELNFGRVPIGGTDFSTHQYAYNMYPEDDLTLSNFSLTMEDFEYKIPMIKEASKLATAKLFLVASIWSPPLWMKTNDAWYGFSLLRTKYYQTYTDYHIKFLEEYKKRNISFWGVTTGNEPSAGLTTWDINSLGWLPQMQTHWIISYFGPTLRESKFKDVKILAVDDVRLFLLPWMNAMVEDDPKVLNYIDGIATHWYTDWLIPPDEQDRIHETYPDKFLFSTESTSGVDLFLPFSDVNRRQIGSWHRAEIYVKRLIDNFNHWMTGWIEWNIFLDSDTDGPSWNHNVIESPIMRWASSGGEEFVKLPIFYSIGHFSKFVPRGSVRVDIEVEGGSGIDNIAFLRPDGGIAVIICNSQIFDKSVIIREEGKGFIEVQITRRSFQTIVYW